MSLPDTPDPNRAEPALISTSLEVEQLDTNLFRSKTLYKPGRHARGVFGGQVISQALVCANNRVDPAFSLHSLHCYFLLSASPAIPVLYYVELLRDGKTYATRSVKAVQNGRIIFILIASYQKPERDQPSRQWSVHPSIPPPEDCQTEESVILARVNDTALSAKARARWEEIYQDRVASPVDIRTAPSVSTDRGTLHAYWMRTRHAPKFDAPLQKCILAYISDIKLIGSAAIDLGLSGSGKGQNRLGMASSLDHNMWFYMDDFDCAEWVLYTMESPVAGSGRGVANGHFFTREGKLIAVTSQEGVLRAALPSPKPKL